MHAFEWFIVGRPQALLQQMTSLFNGLECHVRQAFSIVCYLAYGQHTVEVCAQHVTKLRVGCAEESIRSKRSVLLLSFTLEYFSAVQVVSGNFQDWCSKVVSVLIVVNTCLSFPLPLVPVFKALNIAAVGAIRW